MSNQSFYKLQSSGLVPKGFAKAHLPSQQQSSACSHSGHKKKPIFAALCLTHTQAPNTHPQSPLAKLKSRGKQSM